MANYLKSADLGGHPHGGYAPPHAHHGGHGHGALPPGMPGMAGLPFGLPPGLEGVGFPQGMWGKSILFIICNIVVFEYFA